MKFEERIHFNKIFQNYIKYDTSIAIVYELD